MVQQIKLLWTTNAPEALVMALNPLRPLRMWLNNRTIKDLLTPHIEQEVRKQLDGASAAHKTIISLASRAYLAEQSPQDKLTQIDEHFIDIAVSQIKIFLLAGHDTTASAISYAYYLLHKNPQALAKMRAEHDAVFGSDPSTARSQVAADPALLNQIPYTTAVIKETLRLFPPVGTIRQGQPDCFLTHPETGKRYPTEHFMLFSVSFVVQRDPRFWPRADEFVPERWLAKEGEPLHVQKNTWRPFELGPRNCIGQELAQIELRAILAMTVRELDVESAYPADSPSVLGDQAFQVMEVGQVTGHPYLGMPVRVRMREGAGK
ncbi:uncharacterized protein N7459_003553 [Penicillium hispanicum]|uniref:uncharacterized protein n=1 Tax=Penicillium hispanicum TaxID=1080232 RepID=UPI00253FAC9C|nr:uncharacterized protein N7459_003553 [Penicillium hispanicum]KAJ5587788.1 hypothetical protein N7459_003553 [Penicillium hispanicum]